MNIQIYQGASGCRKAKGVAVVIDVFRATTTICCLLKSKPRSILLGNDINEIADFINVSDVECFSEIKNPYNSHDNSPLKALSIPLENKTTLLVSRNGTIAFDLVRHCDRIFAAALINIDAIVKFLERSQPENISLIAIGHINRHEETIEDNICAEMIRSRLIGKSIDESYVCKKLTKRLKNRRLDPESPQGISVEIDLAICCAIGILDVVPEIVYNNDETRVINAVD